MLNELSAFLKEYMNNIVSLFFQLDLVSLNASIFISTVIDSLRCVLQF